MATDTQQLELQCARRKVLRGGDWLSADELLALASPRDQISEANLSLWLRADQIFFIRSGGTDYFPRYALDAMHGYQPVPDLHFVIRILKTMKNGWEMAFWFASLNSYLGDQRPQDVLHHHMERVIEAARQEVLPISHG